VWETAHSARHGCIEGGKHGRHGARLEVETLAVGYVGGGLGAFLACINAFLRYL